MHTAAPARAAGSAARARVGQAVTWGERGPVQLTATAAAAAAAKVAAATAAAAATEIAAAAAKVAAAAAKVAAAAARGPSAAPCSTPATPALTACQCGPGQTRQRCLFYCIYVLASRYAYAELSLQPAVSVLASNFKSRSMTLVDAKSAPATQSWRLFDLSCRQRGKGHTTPAVTHPRRSDGETRWAPATQSSGTLAALGAAAHAAVQEQTRVQAEATGRREVAPCAQTRTWDKCAGAHWPRE